MPFSNVAINGNTVRPKEELDDFFENSIKLPIIANFEGFDVKRSETESNISENILRNIFQADYLICDLSGTRPNSTVMFELGVRLAISERPVILIRQADQNNHRDIHLSGHHVFEYNPNVLTPLINYIKSKIAGFEERIEIYESVVAKSIGPSNITDRLVSRTDRYLDVASAVVAGTIQEVLVRVYQYLLESDKFSEYSELDKEIQEFIHRWASRKEGYGEDLVQFGEIFEILKMHGFSHSELKIPIQGVGLEAISRLLTEIELKGFLDAPTERRFLKIIRRYYLEYGTGNPLAGEIHLIRIHAFLARSRAVDALLASLRKFISERKHEAFDTFTKALSIADEAFSRNDPD